MRKSRQTSLPSGYEVEVKHAPRNICYNNFMKTKRLSPAVPRMDKLTKQALTEKLRSEIRFNRNWIDVVADGMTVVFGTMAFLVVNAIFFAGWIFLNSPVSPFPLFDPFPFGRIFYLQKRDRAGNPQGVEKPSSRPQRKISAFGIPIEISIKTNKNPCA